MLGANGDVIASAQTEDSTWVWVEGVRTRNTRHDDDEMLEGLLPSERDPTPAVHAEARLTIGRHHARACGRNEAVDGARRMGAAIGRQVHALRSSRASILLVGLR